MYIYTVKIHKIIYLTPIWLKFNMACAGIPVFFSDLPLFLL